MNMKMTYHQRSSRKKRKKSTAIFIVIILFVLLFSIFNITFPKSIINTVGYPVIKVKNFVLSPFSGIGSYFETKNSLIKENEELKDDVARLNVDVLTFGLIGEELKELKENFGLNSEEERTLANVLVRPPYSPYDTFVIDLGRDEVFEGSPVYYNNVRIGIIGSVDKNTSIVKLLSSSGNKFQVRINRSIDTEAYGQGGGRFLAILPKDADINVGDVITIPELTPGVFATVQVIESTEGDTFKGVFFNTPVKLSDISFVEVGGGTVLE